ncbi:serine phosphatase rsbu, regulator of sigma subunit [hydrocarbon metagenome]|uniref:Serine phosphatase rsbu, regulator of sigma subunit n=1 Tax=hydrocarbon metagenome TaxID=938273 RepID=A0A0W8FNE6_9ZZZZ
MYGEPRLRDDLQRAPKDDVAEMIHWIRAEVTRHANGAPQSDDVTMVAIKYRGVDAKYRIPTRRRMNKAVS